ncbi:MAG TPA: acyl-CoA reductase [Candidatus Binataceae bacterium]|nr:acyl-CoA reductase [Candidatus Binataceae bacterium]
MTNQAIDTELRAAMAGMRARCDDAQNPAHDPVRAAGAIATVLDEWRAPGSAPRRAVAERIAARLGFSAALLEASLEALLAPFSRDALMSFAAIAARRREIIGFIMAGNVPGAGLHEVVLALICGAAVVIKTATREPHFFAALAHALRQSDARLGARLAVFNWSREDRDLTAALVVGADRIVAYGDDATLGALGGARVVGFGSRLSGAIVMKSAHTAANLRASAAALARDVTVFEQLGCLSPHHVFVEDASGTRARAFAHELARAIANLALVAAPPESLALEDAAALRRAREIARWREIAGEPVELLEGAGVAWAVIFDRDAGFSPSPGFRTVYVSPFHDREDLCARLAPAAGRLEAISVAGDGIDAGLRAALGALGVSYLAAPGAIQSPALDWRHGGGAFLDAMTTAGARR